MGPRLRLQEYRSTVWYSMSPRLLLPQSGTAWVLDYCFCNLGQHESKITASYNLVQWHRIGHRLLLLTVWYSGTAWVRNYCFLQSGTVAQHGSQITASSSLVQWHSMGPVALLLRVWHSHTWKSDWLSQCLWCEMRVKSMLDLCMSGYTY